MTGCNSETASDAGFIDSSVPDRQHLLNDLTQDVAASIQEGAVG
jgi:hypothetical protein